MCLNPTPSITCSVLIALAYGGVGYYRYWEQVPPSLALFPSLTHVQYAGVDPKTFVLPGSGHTPFFGVCTGSVTAVLV